MHKKITRSFVLVLGIIIIGFLLRLYHLSELFHFTYDEEIIAFVGKRMFVNHHIPLIGGVTPFHVHVAPYFYWLSAIFLFVSKLNPLGWGVVAAFLSIITMSVLYVVAVKLFDKKTALIALSLYAFSFYQNIFDRHYWGLIFDGLIALITFYSLHQLILGKQKYILPLSIFLAFGIHADLSILTLYITSAVIFFIFRSKIKKGIIIRGSIIVLISLLPLLLFDLRHDFSNSRGFLEYFKELSSSNKKKVTPHTLDVLLFIPQSLVRTLYVFGDPDLAKQYSYCPEHASTRSKTVPVVFSLGVLGLFIWLEIRRKYVSELERIPLTLFTTIFVTTYFGIVIYGIIFRGDLFDHYLATLFPIFLLLIAHVLVILLAKYSLVLRSLLILYIAGNLSLILTAHHRFGFQDKANAVQWAIFQTENDAFSLDVISSCFRYNGYRYLFYLYGKEPVKSYVDANFTYLYDAPPAQYHPKLLVVITNPDFVETESYFVEYNHLRSKLIKSAKFGAIEVLIVDNSNLDFVGKF